MLLQDGGIVERSYGQVAAGQTHSANWAGWLSGLLSSSQYYKSYFRCRIALWLMREHTRTTNNALKKRGRQADALFTYVGDWGRQEEARGRVSGCGGWWREAVLCMKSKYCPGKTVPHRAFPCFLAGTGSNITSSKNFITKEVGVGLELLEKVVVLGRCL
eukprot:scaffold6166_cov201-Alexandrium_tamarense.AAC.2